MSLNVFLAELVESTSSHLPAVSRRRMFGCDAWFAHGNIFAMVWKAGRVGVKLTEPADFKALMDLPGSDRWSPGPKMKMSNWVLVPEALHDDPDALAPWIARAHAQASARPPRLPGKAAPTKKVTARAPSSRSSAPTKKAAARAPASRRPAERKATAKTPTSRSPATKKATSAKASNRPRPASSPRRQRRR